MRLAEAFTTWSWWRRNVLTTDHRVVGRLYLLLAMKAVVIGTLLSLCMRIHLAWPNAKLPFWGVMKPEEYLALLTMHGTLMIFFVLVAAPQMGFSCLIAPAQIGAHRLSLPRLNAAGYWIIAASFTVLLLATFVPGGAPISGWTSYPPLSAIAAAGPGQALGMDLWLISIGLFCIGAVLSAVSLLTTIICERCPGMTWERLPLTVWSWLMGALLTVLAFSVLFATDVLLLCDRHAGTSFFVPANGVINGILVNAQGHDGSPLLWLHLFWFFGHPVVYIAVLPGMGIASMLLANFSHRRVPGYRTMIATTLAIGLLGILLWGHHMFVAGLNPFAGNVFAVTTMAIAIPSAIKVMSWLATVWRAPNAVKPRPVPMLWALGFVSFFLTGGLTGPILAQPILDSYLHNTFFVVAHFHLIMAMAGDFSLFAATYYWFPLMTGRMMSERLGRWHFWLTIVAAYSTFLPMHLTGLAGEPRQYAQLTGIPGPAGTLLAHLQPMQIYVTCSAFVLAAAQILFLVNLWRSVFNGKTAPENPWEATTLEWAPAAEELRVVRGPCEYGEDGAHPQWEILTETFDTPE
jgi:cytochrome c oxidase subunit 1